MKVYAGSCINKQRKHELSKGPMINRNYFSPDSGGLDWPNTEVAPKVNVLGAG